MNTNLDYIDTHCHLDLYKDYMQVILQAKKSGTFVVAVTNLPSVYEQEVNFIKGDNLVVALGLHPQLVSEHHHQLDRFLHLLPDVKFIGEVGLDYQVVDDSRKIQRDVFQKILEESAKYKNKILSIHSRRSSEDVVSMIGSNFPGNIILHWYSGTIPTLNKALANGYYFSINPSMILTQSGQKVIKSLPLDRILTETDGPFTKQKNNETVPSDVSIVIDYLSETHKLSSEEVKEIIKMNFLKMQKDKI